jgi:hypothetical protein
MEIIAILAQIVAWADEIRKNMKAKGEEAARQFEEAVARNRVSFAQIVADLGGDLSDEPPPVPEPQPPVDPGPPAPQEPPSSGAVYDVPIVSPPTRPPYLAGDHIYRRTDGRFMVTSRDYGVVGFPGAEYIGDVT